MLRRKRILHRKEHIGTIPHALPIPLNHPMQSLRSMKRKKARETMHTIVALGATFLILALVRLHLWIVNETARSIRYAVVHRHAFYHAGAWRVVRQNVSGLLGSLLLASACFWGCSYLLHLL